TGSDLSLKTLDDGKLEVQVDKGTVVFDHGASDKRVEVGVNERVVFDREDVAERGTISAEINFNRPELVRHYIHGTEQIVKLEWTGDPALLRHVRPDQSVEVYEVDSKSQAEFALSLGTHHFSLEKKHGDDRMV